MRVTSDFDHEEEEEGSASTLRSPIDVRALMAEEGCEFELDADRKRNYFEADDSAGGILDDHTADEIFNRIYSKDSGNTSDDDDEDYDGGFDRKASKMENVTPDGGVKKKFLHCSQRGAKRPPEVGWITVRYTMFLEHADEPFDSTETRRSGRPERRRIGMGEQLPGFELAVRSMCVGEESEFVIRHNYAFGESGCAPRVPPKASILAKIALLHAERASEAEILLQMDPEARRSVGFDTIESAVMIERSEGKSHFVSEDFPEAEERYKVAIRLLETTADEMDAKEELMTALRLNRALCLIRMERADKASRELEKVLASAGKEGNVKALYLMGKAKRMMRHFDEAYEFLKRARDIEHNAEIGREMLIVDKELKKEETRRKELCGKMLGASMSPSE